jgi:hypothetical protein
MDTVPLSGPSPNHHITNLRIALERVMPGSSIAAWMDTPLDAFDGLKPLEVVERGQMDRLWRMVFEIESGQPL